MGFLEKIPKILMVHRSQSSAATPVVAIQIAIHAALFPFRQVKVSYRGRRTLNSASARRSNEPATIVVMRQFDNDQSESPKPETVLAIRGALATAAKAD